MKLISVNITLNQKTLVAQGVKGYVYTFSRQFLLSLEWWRRGESNPREACPPLFGRKAVIYCSAMDTWIFCPVLSLAFSTELCRFLPPYLPNNLPRDPVGRERGCFPASHSDSRRPLPLVRLNTSEPTSTKFKTE